MKHFFFYAFLFFFCIAGSIASAQQYHHNPSRTGNTNVPTDVVQRDFSDPYTKFSIEINGNSSAFEGRLGFRIPLLLSDSVYIGLNGLASDDDFYIVSTDLTYGTRVLDEKMGLDIGLKGSWGEAEKGEQDARMGALALMLKAEYDLPDIEITYSRYLDMEIFGELSISPSPLTFADGDKHMESRCGININLSQNKRSAFTLGYRYIKMDFEDRGDWNKKENSAYLGFRLRF